MRKLKVNHCDTLLREKLNFGVRLVVMILENCTVDGVYQNIVRHILQFHRKVIICCHSYYKEENKDDMS
jgi:hypothetical protein